jgi:hypothetical protein
MTITNEILTSTETVINGAAWEVVTHKGGRTEVYREYADIAGLPQFLGYYEDICRDDEVAEAIQPVVVAHLQAHREFWRTNYLPGAECWFNGL